MALITGDQGSFQFGGQTLSTADFGRWSMQISRPVHEYTPFGWAMTQLAFGQVRGGGTLEAAVNGANATPPIPSGANGNIVLTVTTTPGTKTYTGKAILHQLGISSQSVNGAPVTVYEYAFSFSATTSSETVVVA